MTPRRFVLSISCAATLTAAAAPQSAISVGFDGGSTGDFTGNFFFEAAGGNPDGNAHILLSTWFPSLTTGAPGQPANAAFLGDYTQFARVTLSMDVRVDALRSPFTNLPIERSLGIALVDRDASGPSGLAGVFFELAVLSESAQPDWTALAVTIDDTGATSLPAGWIGFGAEDPSTFEPILPPGSTFTSVLASVDELWITGAVPGFFFSNAVFDARIDNVALETGGELGSAYCTANPNSTGAAGATGATGSIFAASDDVTLTVRELPPGQFGIFAVSRTAGSLPVGDGVLCLGGSVGRFDAPGQVFQADAAGGAAVPIALGAIPLGTGSVPVLPGETWHFQAWHRDVAGGGATSNLALPTRVTFR
ncbi:MAG: hypothetical protein VX460_02585 [Planctomycetota bacterium]|nr:hypothetical protein [Planctomycetota bacterium]